MIVLFEYFLVITAAQINHKTLDDRWVVCVYERCDVWKMCGEARLEILLRKQQWNARLRICNLVWFVKVDWAIFDKGLITFRKAREMRQNKNVFEWKIWWHRGDVFDGGEATTNQRCKSKKNKYRNC